MSEQKEGLTREALVAEVVAKMLAADEQFNEAVTGIVPPPAPTVIKGDRLRWTLSALNEEVKEFEEACFVGDIVESADALIDLIYFALGRLVEMGVPAKPVFEGVHSANMGKERGELSKRPGAMGHDAVKPEGWTPPNHEWLLEFTLADLKELRRLREAERQREALSPVWQRLQQLRETKGQDYNNVPGGRDAYFPFGHLSYAHMVHTKNLRMQSLVRSMLANGKAPNYDSLVDTVEDLVNYATYYAEAIRDGRVAQQTGVKSDTVL